MSMPFCLWVVLGRLRGQSVFASGSWEEMPSAAGENGVNMREKADVNILPLCCFTSSRGMLTPPAPGNFEVVNMTQNRHCIILGGAYGFFGQASSLTMQSPVGRPDLHPQLPGQSDVGTIIRRKLPQSVRPLIRRPGKFGYPQRHLIRNLLSVFQDLSGLFLGYTPGSKHFWRVHGEAGKLDGESSRFSKIPSRLLTRALGKVRRKHKK